mgnify:CR=1 FL=1
MLKVEKPQDLLQHVGKELGPSEWLTVTQEMIDKFADATGDHQWIHVDVERAKKELPGGKTIAHGYLTLSLLPQLAPTLMKIEKRRRGLNYGSNRVRFTAPVPAGAKVRARFTLAALLGLLGGAAALDRLALPSSVLLQTALWLACVNLVVLVAQRFVLSARSSGSENVNERDDTRASAFSASPRCQASAADSLARSSRIGGGIHRPSRPG